MDYDGMDCPWSQPVQWVLNSLIVARSKEDTARLPPILCANDTTMESRHQRNKVDYKLVNLQHPARLAVLMRCLNHVVHWEHGARESTHPEQLLQQGGCARPCSLHRGPIRLRHRGAGHHWQRAGYVRLLQVGAKTFCELVLADLVWAFNS